jgi:DNA mismatch repair protein MutS
LQDGGYIKESSHPRLEELHDLINNANSYILRLKHQYQIKTGVDNLKITNNNLIGMFIEVTVKQSAKMNDPEFMHKQTTATAVRYTTTKLQELENQLLTAKTSMVALENEIFNDLCSEIAVQASNLQLSAKSLSMIDVFSSFAHNAMENNYIRPIVDEGFALDIKDGRHPVVEKKLQERNLHFTSNDCHINNSEQIWLITGPNMGGKSTFLRQNAIIVLMAQIGSYVPASYCRIGVVDRVFSRIGSGDDLSKGHSTFMIEMFETASILTQATHKSLVVFDEIGRGTSTYDGVALAWSILEYIRDVIGCKCVFATHYHELTSMSDESVKKISNYHASVIDQGGKIVFLHRILPGVADKSYGIHVAEIAGLPASVIDRAKKVLCTLESNYKRDM